MRYILCEEKNQHVCILLNRPEKNNALNRELLLELKDSIASLKDNHSARAVIFSSTGEKAFCAGADLKERQGMPIDEVLNFVSLIQTTFNDIAELPMPTIAAMNGDAFGGGLELALACDLRVAPSEARLGLTETALGIIPAAGGSKRLPRLIGLSPAMDMIFQAKRISGREALELGLINYVVDSHEDVMKEATKLAHNIALQAPLAVRAAKKALVASQRPSKEELAQELMAYQEILHSKDRLEGLNAFLEKRRANYIGQ
jgi:methylglutaconyl-CoA hydratase